MVSPPVRRLDEKDTSCHLKKGKRKRNENENMWYVIYLTFVSPSRCRHRRSARLATATKMNRPVCVCVNTVKWHPSNEH